MTISKAIITAAAVNQRTLPLQTLVDRDGQQKSVLRILVEEAQSAGIEQICVVVHPGDANAYQRALSDGAENLTFVAQTEPLGYGHAIFCAREFAQNEPFLHMISDHI